MEHEAANPFSDSKVDDISQQDGQIDVLPVLAIDIKDRELIDSLNRKIRDSEDYWNDPKGYNLKYARNQNVKMHLGKHIDESRLYTYQVPYMDNEIFVGVETIAAYVTSSIPKSETYPATDTDASKILAADLEKVHVAHGEKFNIQKIVENVARNLLLKRVGVIKQAYDPFIDDIVPTAPNPDHLVFDKNAKQGSNPGFIAETLTASVEKLVGMFPEKKDDIFSSLGIVRGTPKQMGNIVAYKEVWFSYWDKSKECEGLAIYFKDVMLLKVKNPNYIYKEEGAQVANFLDYPAKPYIIFNYINDGSHVIDQTSPVEQATPLQEILNKRGRQIVENADTANGTLVLRSGAMSADDAQNITHDPQQTLILDSPNDPVSSAYGQINPMMLPQYVMDDKMDLRSTIHNILGTPSQFRGDDSSRQNTLGQDVMIKNQASGRQDAIVRSLDVGMGNYFRQLTQMFKVHYTEKHYFTINGDDGNFDFIEMSRENIEERATVNVRTGSMLPYDKAKQEQVSLALAKMGLIDPYNLFKDLHLDNADKRFDALVKYQKDAMSLRESVIDELSDRSAYIDFVEIMNGRDAKPRDDADKDHILTHRKQMISDRFTNADIDKQRAMIDHVQAEVNGLAQRTALDEASAAGVLTDPKTPVTADVPQPPAPMMPPMGMPQAMPPIDPLQGGMPQLPPVAPAMPPQVPSLDPASIMQAAPPVPGVL